MIAFYPAVKHLHIEKTIKLENINAIKSECEIIRDFCTVHPSLSLLSDAKINITTIQLTKQETWIKERFRFEEELYFIHIEEKNNCFDILISYASKKAVFNAMHTIFHMLTQQKIIIGKMKDYPDFPIRGIVEGYYGKPWSLDERKSMIKYMASHKFNLYFYAPKDDDYHREKWQELYPQENINMLVDVLNVTKHLNMHFCYGLGPGLSMEYSNPHHGDLLLKKYKQIFDMGVRKFALLFDDIPNKLQHENDRTCYTSLSQAHGDIVNKLYNFLMSLDTSIQLFVCPTEYWGMPEKYLIDFGNSIDARIELFWTGKNICSQELTVFESAEFTKQTNHRPLYWDNYPVNDLEMSNKLHIGSYINRDRDLYKFSNGIIANAMEYAESSKIAIACIGDYTWNAHKYNSEQSWRNALKEIVGENDCDDFYNFASNSKYSHINLYDDASVLQNAQDEFDFLILQSKEEKAYDYLLKTIEPLIQSGENLLNAMDNKNLHKECVRWMQKYYMGLSLLKKVLIKKRNKETDFLEIEKEYKEYMNMPEYIFADVLYLFLDELIKK